MPYTRKQPAVKTPFPKYDAQLVAEIEDYLDIDFQTGIYDTYNADIEPTDGLNVIVANGKHDLGAGHQYTRPMFQVLPPGSTCHSVRVKQPCPSCDQWQYSQQCADHPDTGLPQPPEAVESRLIAAYEEVLQRRAVPLGDAVMASSIQNVIDSVAERRGNFSFPALPDIDREGVAFPVYLNIEASERSRNVARIQALLDNLPTGSIRITATAYTGILTYETRPTDG